MFCNKLTNVSAQMSIGGLRSIYMEIDSIPPFVIWVLLFDISLLLQCPGMRILTECSLTARVRSENSLAQVGQ